MAESFYIGMDLCPDSTQISFYNDIKREPETVNQLNNKETYMMPNILFFSRKTGDWFVGSEASEASTLSMTVHSAMSISRWARSPTAQSSSF